MFYLHIKFFRLTEMQKNWSKYIFHYNM